MKKLYFPLIVTIALSLAIWFYFYVKTPEARLNASETLLVVGVCAAFVFFTKWIINRIQKKGSKKGEKKNENNT